MKSTIQKIGLTLTLTIIIFFARTQIMIQPQLPSQGLIQQDQLWNILVVNNRDAIAGCTIQLSFQEEGTGQKIFMATTGPLILPSGASQLTAKDVGAVQYNYISSGMNPALSGGLLPMGRFVACYSVFAPSEQGGQAIAEECLPVTIEPFAPPQLAYPADQSELSTTYPVFNWIPPMPVNMFTNLRYRIVLTEMNKGQSAADAIQRNPILFFQDGIKDPALTYPSSYVALVPGKTYAWQVIAQNDNTYSASTEIWSFTVKNDPLAVVLDNASYPHLQQGIGSNHFVVHEKIKFSYSNESGDSVATVRVFGYNSQDTTTLMSKTVKIRRGMNFIDFELGNPGLMQKQKSYVLEIVNGWKEHWDLKFRYEPLNP